MGSLACKRISPHTVMPLGCLERAGRLPAGSTGPGCRGCRCLQQQHRPGHCHWLSRRAGSEEHTGSPQGRLQMGRAPPACSGSLDLGHLDCKRLLPGPAPHGVPYEIRYLNCPFHSFLSPSLCKRQWSSRWATDSQRNCSRQQLAELMRNNEIEPVYRVQ